MHFLLILKFRPDRVVDLDVNKQSIQFLESVQKFIESNRKSGKMIFDGAFQDGKGAMSIVRGENEKELKEFIADIPFKEIVDIETIPLEESIEAIQKQKLVLGVKK